MKDYEAIARGMRGDILKMLCRANGSFAGGALSCADIIAVLFYSFMRFGKPDDPNRDMFFLSKGHASSALYAGLASVGAIEKTELETYGANGTKMMIHPKRGTYPYIDASTGALGHGLPLASGSALAARIRGCGANVFVLMGDGECNEGSVWENAAFASKQKLNNLVVIVDRNGLQGCGRDAEVLNYGDIGEKFRAFGFDAVDIDGHNCGEIENALKQAVSRVSARPAAIIAKTIKGRGVSFMEDKLEWHYKSPDAGQLKTAFEKLGL